VRKKGRVVHDTNYLWRKIRSAQKLSREHDHESLGNNYHIMQDDLFLATWCAVRQRIGPRGRVYARFIISFLEWLPTATNVDGLQSVINTCHLVSLDDRRKRTLICVALNALAEIWREENDGAR